MTTATRERIIGEPVDRVDGPLKVTGAAQYPSDFTFPDLTHAVLVQSTIAAGTIRSIDVTEAQAAPGVHAVITHENAPAIAEGPMTRLGPSPPFPLKDTRILHHGQHVAVVVAATREHAAAAARLIQIDYEQAAPVLRIDDSRAPVLLDRWGQDVDRGDVTAALAVAEVVYDENFTTAAVTPNPMGLFATMARWDGDRLTVHDANQDPVNTRRALATVFELPETDVRVLVPYLGGGFGAGLRAWPHVILTALAARVVSRPVKLVLTRPQMFTSVGHRPETLQRVRLGATRDGRLVAVDHEGTSTLGALDDGGVEPVTQVTGNAYACPNVQTHDRRARLHIPSPHWMRAPGSAQGNFALESALDELSYTLGIDPIELRLRNYTEVHPGSGLPWSSEALRDCYRVGAQRFGWSRRTPEIRSMRDGNWLVGYGMAGVTFTSGQARCEPTVSIRRDGTAHVRSAATDLGTGTYTIATQVASLTNMLPQHYKPHRTEIPPAQTHSCHNTISSRTPNNAAKRPRRLTIPSNYPPSSAENGASRSSQAVGSSRVRRWIPCERGIGGGPPGGSAPRSFRRPIGYEQRASPSGSHSRSTARGSSAAPCEGRSGD
jgi:xanthine dehydrogenase YagR molybdenum-binding subunit